VIEAPIEVVWVENSKVGPTGAWWVKDLLVTLKRERTEGRYRVIMLEELVVWLNIERPWR